MQRAIEAASKRALTVRYAGMTIVQSSKNMRDDGGKQEKNETEFGQNFKQYLYLASLHRVLQGRARRRFRRHHQRWIHYRRCGVHPVLAEVSHRAGFFHTGQRTARPEASPQEEPTAHYRTPFWEEGLSLVWVAHGHSNNNPSPRCLMARATPSGDRSLSERLYNDDALKIEPLPIGIIFLGPTFV